MTTITSSSGVTFARTTEPLDYVKTALNTKYYQETATGIQVVDPDYPLPAGWTEHLGGKFHNLIDSFINFNPTGSTDAKFDIVDRSNITTNSAASRASIYYDGTDRTTSSIYHISELPYDVLNTYFETDYIDRVFFGYQYSYADKQWIFVGAVYATKKIGEDLTQIKKYIRYE